MKVLAYPYLEDSTGQNVMSNYKFYTLRIAEHSQPLKQPALEKATDSLNLAEDGTFVKSTPSLIVRGNHLIVNVRYVNYRIDDNGNYVNQENIITKNAIATLDISKKKWDIVDEFELVYYTGKDGHYIGLEDVRMFLQDKTVLYNANRGMPDGTMTVEHGKIAVENKSTKDSKWMKGTHHIEKNWVILPGGPKGPQVVYHWTPDLIIGEMRMDTFVEKQRQPVPKFFKNVRGSTNGVVIKDEIWLICHAVSYEDRRYYYHIVVVLDKDTFALKRYTPFWTFEGKQVEYTLGFVYLEGTDQLLIGYSLYDKCAKYIRMERSFFENQMIPFV
jgi:predicted GH43/DUF377 family glycosyl hydrolase